MTTSLSEKAVRKSSTVSIEELDTSVCGAVARVYRRLRTERADDQISESQRSVLAYLVKEGPRTLSELSDYEHVKPPSMNQTVNVLVALGFVQRSDDPLDGRKVILAPTPTGRARIEATRQRLHAWLQSQLQELTIEERETLRAASAIMSKIADA